MTTIKFALHNDNPQYTPLIAHEGDACYDLFARAYSRHDELDREEEEMQLHPGQRCLARTGVFLQLEPGWEALVRPRSGNALKLGLTVLNTPGTIDAGYRNEVGVILHNAGHNTIVLKHKMKIAQIAFRQIPPHRIEALRMADFNTQTDRSLNGFGSSGV